MDDGGGILQMIREGGLWALVVVVLGSLGNLLVPVVVVAGFATKKRTIAIALVFVAALLALGILGVGTAGMLLGEARVDTVLGFVEEANRAGLRERGYHEAAIPFNLSLFFAAFPSFAAFILIGLTTTKTKES